MTDHNERTIVILQPGYLPWLGFFEQMHRSDIFVIYDDVQYDKHGWRNRNRIKTPQGWQWLTVPVLTSGQNKPINKDVQIDNLHNWFVKHAASIRQHYSKAPFFDAYFQEFNAIYEKSWKFLIDLDLTLIELITDSLRLKRELKFASDLGVQGSPTERLALICKHLGGTRFYEGKAGADYIDASIFQAHNVELVFQDYHHPEYSQLYGDFVGYMSIIDLLFNHGPDSLDILLHRKEGLSKKVETQ